MTVRPVASVSVMVPAERESPATVVEPVRGDEPFELDDAITVIPILKFSTSRELVSVMTFDAAEDRRPRWPLPSRKRSNARSSPT